MRKRLIYLRFLLRITLRRRARFRPEGRLEVHSLVDHRSVVLYLIAVTSLARHLPSAAVTVHDDGTLTRVDRLLLRWRVPGIRIVARDEADALVERELAGFPHVLAARRDNVRLRQLVDYFVLASTGLVIGMDSDVVFLSRPDAVLEWAEQPDGERASVMYSPETDPKGPHWLPDAVPGAPYVPDMCCGFVCAERGSFFDPRALESLLARVPRDIVDHRRFVTQMLYSLLAAREGQTAVSLGPLYRSGRLAWLPDEPRRVLCHYFASHRRDGALQNLVEERPLLSSVARAATT